MDYKLGRIRSLITTRLNMLFSPTLPAKTTQEVMLSDKNANAKQFYCQAMLMLTNAKEC